MKQILLLLTAASVALAVPSASAAAQDRSVDLSSDWWPVVQQQIVDSEYHVTWQEQLTLDGVEGSWQAPNRNNGFRTFFLSDGIRVVPRTTEQPVWQLGLSLARIGRKGALQEVGTPRTVDVDQSRIESDRGAVIEWYVNDRNGLEQGFTLLERPEVAAAGPLHLELGISGSLVPRFSDDGQAIDFVSASEGVVLRYAQLVVLDATGTKLPAKLEGFTRKGAGGIRIVVDDGYAVYPVVVDPLLTSASWTDEGNQANEEFGFAVATAGDVNDDGYSDVIVGARLFDGGEADEGSVFVYHGSASGLGVTPAWQYESNMANAELGYSVQTAGDVNADGKSDVIVGCPMCDLAGAGEVAGGALVFHGSAAGLVTPPAWTGSGDQGGMEYGFSVAAAGDVDGDGFGDVLVGAPY